MSKKSVYPGAQAFLPESKSWQSLRESAQVCRGCDLYQIGTQTVFGEGQGKARIFFIGEQPGDEEDRAGRPFVGPSGRLLDQSLVTAGIERKDAYVTNVVKHFKWQPKGKRRLHQKPNAAEVHACIPWIEEEIAAIEPELLVLLGATAAQALLGKDFRVTQQRGVFVPTRWGVEALATVHPSSILRQSTPEERERELDHFVQDLRTVARRLD